MTIQKDAATQPTPPSPLGRATVTTYGAHLAVAALSLANVLVMARTLGPAGRGDVASLTAVTWLTAFCFTVSLHEAMANRAATHPQDRAELAGGAIVLALGLGAAGAAAGYAAVTFVPFLRLEADGPALAVALLAIPVLILQTYFSYLVRAGYAVGVANVALLCTATGVALNAVLAVLGLLTPRAAILVWAGAQLGSVLVLGGYLARRLRRLRMPSRALLRDLLPFGVRAHGAGLTNSATYRIDSWLLGSLAGSHQLGVYSVAVAWFEGLFLLPQAVLLAIRPAVTRAGDELAGRLATLAVAATLLITLVSGVLLYLAAPLLCTGIFGPEFAESVPLLRLLIPGALGIATLKILGSALTARGRPGLESAAGACAFAVAVGLYVTLIPQFGAAGAAIASTVAYLVGGGAAAAIFGRTFHRPGRRLLPRLADVAAAARGDASSPSWRRHD